MPGQNKNEEPDSEYEEIDLTDNPMYQVLSALLENENGENVVDMLEKLVVAVKENTKSNIENKCQCPTKNIKIQNCNCDEDSPCKQECGDECKC